MGGELDQRLDAFADQRGAAGFTFDELAEAAPETGTSLAHVADWLARRHASGALVDLGAAPAAGEDPGPRRYRLATAMPKGDRLDMRLPAEPRTATALRWAAVEFATAHRVIDTLAVALAVSEAVTNAVVHAYHGRAPGEVRLVMCAEPERVVVVVRDWGDGMRPRTDSPGLGIGLPTIANLASFFNIEVPDGGGTLLRMHFPRAPALTAA